jgi:hypothetical protein
VWGKEDEVTTARRVHAIAMHVGAIEVRIDSAGMGGGIATMLVRLPEFANRTYTVIRVSGAQTSNDRDRWQLWRDEIHDNLRSLMHDGKIDLDRADKLLRDEMLIITYELNNRGAVKITPKRQMRTALGGSPDRTDAVIYAAIDTKALTGGPLNGMQPGDRTRVDPWALLNKARVGPGMPI